LLAKWDELEAARKQLDDNRELATSRDVEIAAMADDEIPELEKEVKVLDLPLPEEAETMEILEREADRQTAFEGAGLLRRPGLAVAYKLAGRGVEPVVLEVMKPNPDTGQGWPPLVPTGELRTYRIPVNDRFVDSLTRPLPAGYFLPAGEGDVAVLLRLHGIQVRRLGAGWTDTVEVLTGTQLKWATREFQGHYLLEVTGTWAPLIRTLPAGAYFVPTAQPLGRLVFALLEPEGYGLVRWGRFDRLLGGESGALSGLVYGSSAVGEFPLWRAARAPRAPMRSLP